MLTHLIHIIALWDRYYYHSHFTDEVTEAERGLMSSLRSPKWMAKPGSWVQSLYFLTSLSKTSQHPSSPCGKKISCFLYSLPHAFNQWGLVSTLRMPLSCVYFCNPRWHFPSSRIHYILSELLKWPPATNHISYSPSLLPLGQFFSWLYLFLSFTP